MNKLVILFTYQWLSYIPPSGLLQLLAHNLPEAHVSPSGARCRFVIYHQTFRHNEEGCRDQGGDRRHRDRHWPRAPRLQEGERRQLGQQQRQLRIRQAVKIFVQSERACFYVNCRAFLFVNCKYGTDLFFLHSRFICRVTCLLTSLLIQWITFTWF